MPEQNTFLFLLVSTVVLLLVWMVVYKRVEDYLAKKRGRKTKDFDIIKKEKEEETDPRKKYLKAAKNVLTPGQEKFIKGMMGITLSKHRKKQDDT